MSSLFGRTWKVSVDNLDVSALDIEFKILRTLKRQPNKAIITVYNLSLDHRAQLLKRNRPNSTGKLVGITVKVEAGYVNNSSVLIDADLREVTSQRDGSDWKTSIAGDDGGRSYREGRVNKCFIKGTPISFVLQQCAEAMNIGLGNVSNFESQAEIAGIGTMLSHPLNASGSAAEMLDRVIRSIGFTWSIQNGALQVLAKGVPLNLAAIVISPDTGLVGSPEATIDSTVSLGNPNKLGKPNATPRPPTAKDPSVLRLKTLLIPGLVPGRKIELKSASFNGGYYLTEVLYNGQSWGNAWHCDCVARIY